MKKKSSTGATLFDCVDQIRVITFGIRFNKKRRPKERRWMVLLENVNESGGMKDYFDMEPL